MARVIKGNPAQAPAARRPVPKLRDSEGGRKVIEKEVWEAQQEAGRILEEAEHRREQLLAEGRVKAKQAREEAQAEGAQEAFEEAAQEALVAFRRRAERFGEAADDIKVLAHEVAKKILGSNLQLDPRRVDKIVSSGMAQLRARRKLRVQVPQARRRALIQERPILMDALASEPDLVIEAADDVSPGRARIVTEIGGALCSEQQALDALTQALDIDERAVAPRPQSAVHDQLDPPRSATGDVDPGASEEGPAWEDDSSEEEATQFLKDPQEAVRTGTSRVSLVDEERVARRARPSAPRPKPPTDAERTMALDVGPLRDELNRDEPSDELDLFADDAVRD